jgi:peptidoglycan hydrolase-like protein with peptidoglycan-binding domain
MVANRSHQQQQTEAHPALRLGDSNDAPVPRAHTSERSSFQRSFQARNARRRMSIVSNGVAKPSKRFALLLALAALTANLAGGTLEAHAQAKTAGPAIPKAPASAAAPARPAATPAPPAAAPAPTPRPAPAARPRPRRAATQVSRPKAKAVPKAKRAVARKTAKDAPKTKTVSTGGGGSAGGGFGQGASGPKVTAVQERLAVLHYDVTSADGKYGDQLYHAVMAFQKVNGLSRTGRVNAQTLAALDTATDPAPQLGTGGADRIEVDLEKQYLALYKGGAIYRLLSISSGSGKEFCVYDPETKKTECDKAVTPGGSFRVRSRWVGWRESKLGLLYNPLYFNGGIAIHGAPSVPATPASHGCVRIPMISAQWFPEQVADGTPVYVFGGEEGAPVPLKSKAPADAKTAPTTAPTNTLATIPPAGSSTATTKPGSALPSATLPAASLPPATLPSSNTLAPVPATIAPTTTAAPTTTTTTGLARLLTPLGTPVTAAPGATVPGATITGVVVAGTVNATTTVAGATPIATQISGSGTTTTRPASVVITSVGATPIATAVGASATTTTTTTTAKPATTTTTVKP